MDAPTGPEVNAGQHSVAAPSRMTFPPPRKEAWRTLLTCWRHAPLPDSRASLSDHVLCDTSMLTFLTVFAASSFVSLACESTYRLSRMKSWYLWPLAVAAVLESVGFVFSLYFSQHPNQHVVYFVSFATMELAPTLVTLATIVTFGRLISWVAPVEKQARSWTFSADIITPLFVALEVSAASVIGFGVYNVGKFLSPAKIYNHGDALQRLVHYERGVTALRIGHILETATLVMFGLVAVHFFITSSRWQTAASMDSRKLSGMTVAVIALNAVRAVYKVAEFSDSQSTYGHLAVNNGWFWLLDALPVLLSVLLFCARHPGNFLPQEYTNLWLKKSVALPNGDSEKCMLI